MSQDQMKYEAQNAIIEWEFDFDCVKKHRVRMQLSKRALGRLSGLSEATIRRIEDRSHEARADTIIKLCKAFSIAPADFFIERGNK